jgi:putative oxidoreductase
MERWANNCNVAFKSPYKKFITMGIFSANISARAINAGLLVLRVGMGVLCIPHGYDKIVNFNTYKPMMINFLGLGQAVSLGLSTFAEFFCAILVVFGLFTRLACIPLIINFFTAVFIAHGADIIFYMKDGKPAGTAEHPMMYGIAFLTLLITGPGRYSADSMFKR